MPGTGRVRPVIDFGPGTEYHDFEASPVWIKKLTFTSWPDSLQISGDPG